MSYFDRDSADFEDWQQAEEEMLHDAREEYYASLQEEAAEEAWGNYLEEVSFWINLEEMVDTNSYRLDDTPIFNALAVERRDWAFLPRCPHGLSADLCEGPQHYPPDSWEF